MTEPVLVANRLGRSFLTGARRIEVLKDLDLELMAGERLAIVGQSGVGKSTLLHLLGGLDRADSGSLRFRGREIRIGSDAMFAYRNHSVGFVFQFHYLLPEFSALENVEMPFRIARAPRGFTDRAREILVQLGLEARLDHRPGALSGGEQQRVAIARAVVMQPEVVLADEPTGNLDPRTGEKVFDLLRDLQRERGFAMILVTHNERLAAGCDRVLKLEEGRLSPLGDEEREAYFHGETARAGGIEP